MEYVKYFHASVSEFLALSRIWAPNGIIIEYCRDGFLRNIYVRVRIFRINVVLIYVNLCVTGHQHLIHVNFPWTYQLHPRSNIQFESIKHSIRIRTWWQRAFISIFRYQITKNLPPNWFRSSRMTVIFALHTHIYAITNVWQNMNLMLNTANTFWYFKTESTNMRGIFEFHLPEAD